MVADKGTFNRKTNQAVINGIMQKSKRVANLVEAPLLYKDAATDNRINLIGGSPEKLADGAIDVMKKFDLGEEHVISHW